MSHFVASKHLTHLHGMNPFKAHLVDPQLVEVWGLEFRESGHVRDNTARRVLC